MKNAKDFKIALVHDFLIQYGGAERVLEVFGEMFPEAPIYTLLYEPEKMHGKFAGKTIRTSFLQKFPRFLRKRYRWLLPFFPTAPETFDLREYDLILSSSGAWSKGIVTRLDTVHVAYIHSPMRFLWDYNEKYLREEKKRFLGFIIRPFLSYLRLWDRLAADRPEYLIANSKYTQARIEKYYRRESAVVYPPVGRETRNVKPETNEAVNAPRSLPRRQAGTLQAARYFLIVSRLSAYKKIDKAIEAFNKMNLPLVIVGEGKEEKRLKAIAGKNVKFLGWQDDEKMEEIYAGARAFIFPGVDDFGMAPAEAMARGVPVLAIKKGGAVEIVEAGKTGEFFEKAETELIVRAVNKFVDIETSYDKEYIRQSAERFGKERFVREVEEFVSKVLENSPNSSNYLISIKKEENYQLSNFNFQ